jgi:hypothetical protein
LLEDADGNGVIDVEELQSVCFALLAEAARSTDLASIAKMMSSTSSKVSTARSEQQEKSGLSSSNFRLSTP